MALQKNHIVMEHSMINAFQSMNTHGKMKNGQIHYHATNNEYNAMF